MHPILKGIALTKLLTLYVHRKEILVDGTQILFRVAPILKSFMSRILGEELNILVVEQVQQQPIVVVYIQPAKTLGNNGQTQTPNLGVSISRKA